MPWGLAIGGGVGLLKGATLDRDKERRERELAAATQRYSPWTGLQAQPIHYADPFGSAMQGATTGGMMTQKASTAAALKKYFAEGGTPNVNFNTGGFNNDPFNQTAPPPMKYMGPDYPTPSWG